MYPAHKAKGDGRTHSRTDAPTHSSNHTRTAALVYPLQRCCEEILNIGKFYSNRPTYQKAM